MLNSSKDKKSTNYSIKINVKLHEEKLQMLLRMHIVKQGTIKFEDAHLSYFINCMGLIGLTPH